MTYDDTIPPKPRGRRITVAEPDPFGAVERTDKTCGDCPTWDAPRSWCPVKAESARRCSHACRYGLKLIAARGRRCAGDGGDDGGAAAVHGEGA